MNQSSMNFLVPPGTDLVPDLAAEKGNFAGVDGWGAGTLRLKYDEISYVKGRTLWEHTIIYTKDIVNPHCKIC